MKTSGLLQLLLSILLIECCSSLQFSYSPPELDFEESGCKDVYFYSDSPIEINITDLWSARYSRDIRDYNLSRPETVHVDYASSFALNNKASVSVCAYFNDSAYGVLLAYPQDSSFGFGIWLDLANGHESSNYAGKEYSNSIVTGRAIDDSFIGMKTDYSMLILGEISFILACILVLLLIVFRAKKIQR